MPVGKRKKPVYAWPDDQKHKEVESPEEEAEQSVMGSMPRSGSDEVADVEDIAKSAGIYDENAPNPDVPDSGPENPTEVGIGEQIEENKEG